jgi:hypothetical protein
MSTRVTCPDPSALVSYLYGEFEPGETPTRDEVSRHLEQCGRCANEIVALGGVREQLAAWTTPEADLGFQIVQSPATRTRGRLAWMPSLSGADPRLAGSGGSRWSGGWSGVPMAAAAVLVLGAALGLARLDVQYDASGLRVRTGWGHAGATSETASGAAAATTGSVSARPANASASTSAPAPLTTADIDALAERLRRELASSVTATSSVAGDPAPAPQTVSLTPTSEAALLKRLRQLVDESEMRQQQNLQLRVSELAREFQGRRQADLVQIEQGFGRLTSDNEAQRQIIREYFRNASTGARPQ